MKKFVSIIVTVVLLSSIIMEYKVQAAYKVTLVGIQETGHDHTSYYSNINNSLNDIGYNDSEIQEYTDISRNAFLDLMDDREIIVIRSHGGYATDSLGNIDYTYMTLGTNGIFSNDFENLSSNISNAKIFIFGGCYTAIGGPSDSTVRNLIVQSNLKGVRVAIGFQDSILCVGANTWTSIFFLYLAGGSNVDQAATAAVQLTKLNHWSLINSGLNIDSMRYRGDWYMTF